MGRRLGAGRRRRLLQGPVTAHGITDALRDAELLSDEVVEVLAGGAAEDAALARYQATRDRLSRGLFDATEAVAAYAWDLEEVRGLLRRVSSAMSDEVDHLRRCLIAPSVRSVPGCAA